MSPRRGSSPATTAFTSTKRAAATRPTSRARGGTSTRRTLLTASWTPKVPHAGDLVNLHVDNDGTVTYVVTTSLITLTEGERAIFDSDGSAVILHAQPDDYVTDSGGESGDRIACGVIEQE